MPPDQRGGEAPWCPPALVPVAAYLYRPGVRWRARLQALRSGSWRGLPFRFSEHATFSAVGDIKSTRADSAEGPQEEVTSGSKHETPYGFRTSRPSKRDAALRAC